MLFLELAAQSVRGFSPSVRVALKPGYVALQSPVELPAPLSGLVAALAFPDGRGGDGAFLAPGAKTGRAGLSIQGNDGSVWRIVRDLGGAGGLHKLNRATNAFEIVTQDANEMGQTLRASAGFPARTTWEQLFTLNGPQLPTRRPKGPAKSAATGPTKAAPRMMSKWGELADDAGGVDLDPSRLPALEAELATAKRAAEVQFRADGIASEVYELEAKVRTAEEARGALNAARAELANVSARTLPDDIVARAKKLPDDQKRHEDQVAKLRDEMQALADAAPQAPEPLQKDPRFLASVGVGLALLIAGAVLDGGARYLALLSLVPFTFGALLALRFIEDLQRMSRGGGKLEVLQSREKKLVDDFQMHTLSVTRAFETVGVSTLDEFLTAMDARAALAGRVAELEQREAAVRGELVRSGVQGRYDTLKAEQEKLNQELLGMSGGYVRDVRDIEREIAKLKEPVAAPKPATPEFSAVPTGAAETWDDPVPPLMMLATDLFSSDVPSLWSVLHDRAVQYLSALTDRRYHEISVDKDGHATVEAPGRSVSVRELPGRDLDLVFLALRLTLIEKASAQHKLPVVIEDTFNTVIDAAKQPLFGRMVKHLGSLTQVIHVSGAGQNASLADVAVTI